MASTPKPQPIPDRYRRVTPALVVDGATKALEFYAEVFGATERMRGGPGGTIAHAEIEIGDSVVMVEDASPFMGTKAPPTGGFEGSPTALFIYVEDVDATMERAEKLGATIERPASDQSARAFMIPDTTVAQRITRAKRNRRRGHPLPHPRSRRAQRPARRGPRGHLPAVERGLPLHRRASRRHRSPASTAPSPCATPPAHEPPSTSSTPSAMPSMATTCSTPPALSSSRHSTHAYPTWSTAIQ